MNARFIRPNRRLHQETLIKSVLQCSPRMGCHNPAGMPDWTANTAEGEQHDAANQIKRAQLDW